MWLKSNNIKEIPGSKLIKKLTSYHRVHTKFFHIYSQIWFQIHMIFLEAVINFLIDIPESAPKLNVFTWLITFYRIPIKFFPNMFVGKNLLVKYLVLLVLQVHVISRFN